MTLSIAQICLSINARVDELLNNDKLDHSLEEMRKYAILINLHFDYLDITLNIKIENETNYTFKDVSI